MKSRSVSKTELLKHLFLFVHLPHTEEGSLIAVIFVHAVFLSMQAGSLVVHAGRQSCSCRQAVLLSMQAVLFMQAVLLKQAVLLLVCFEEALF